ncbi:MAG TPA: ABC transporter ATP-binding protein [Tepidisphaeraceae bacterium]|nr:ABC transporter ATP-binding protein [Tepidisphaeraceae bacterium]
MQVLNQVNSKTGGIAVDMQAVRREFQGGVVAVDGLNLHVASGEFLSVLGPSGCGKSTLLRMIAGLDQPTSGTVQISSQKGRVAFVFQDAHLLPWRNVLTNVALPLELMGVPPIERFESARDAIEQVGLADAINRYPGQLSGGMRMRASLARALITNPDLLLLDEPFAALDEITRQQLDEQLYDLWQSRGMTVIFVTHSTIEAAYLAQRAIVMSRRPGRIVLDHRLDLPSNRDANLRMETGFAGQMRVLFDALDRQGIGQ